MGQICVRDAAGARDKKIQQHQQAHKKEEGKILKLLLLGTGESGKSTIFKQARHLFKEKFKEEELFQQRPLIYDNIVTQLHSVSKQIKDMSYDEGKSYDALDFYPSTAKWGKDRFLDTESAEVISKFWNSAPVKEVWKKRSSFQVFDTLEYFMKPENLSRVARGSDFVPVFQDIVMARARTAGIVTQEFKIQNTRFKMFDVGGQRSERKKWLTCFDDVQAVLFVTAINEFDQGLFEEQSVNRLEEAVSVWNDVVNREQFQNVAFVVFLNKYDLFVEKLKYKKFRVKGGMTQNYEGPEPCELEGGAQKEAIYMCLEYLKGLFMDQIASDDSFSSTSQQKRIINYLESTAINSKNMESVLTTVEQHVLQQTLIASGFAA